MKTHSLFKILALIILVVFRSTCSYADEEIPKFTAPGKFDFITLGAKTTKDAFKMSFSKKSIPAWLAIAASTTLLYIYDEEILSEVQRWGRDTGIGNNDNTNTLIKIGNTNLFRGPTDIGSTLYFIGDGWTHLAISSAFLVSGAINNDNRALQTGNQIIHGMIMETIPNQLLKRVTGRESPSRSTKERGAWRPFPSISTYNNNQSKYDAMPSGHIMTATMTMTVIDLNYPEYRKVIRPLGFTLITLLGLQMINNSVHWASDYPLGIGMGYVYGKVVSRQGRIEDDKSSLNIFPYYNHSNDELELGLMISRAF
jgi:hypothetical protein